MVSKIIIIVFNILLSFQMVPSMEQTEWLRIGYYWYNSEYGFPVSEINSALFTHIICAFAEVNSTSYQLSLSPAEEKHFSTFTDTVKQKNPSVKTLLSITDNPENVTTTSSMVRNSSYRKSFIESAIKIARLYGFQGLDLAFQDFDTEFEMFNMGVLFKEFSNAISLEAQNTGQSQLILTAAVDYSPSRSSSGYPVEIQKYLNWVHVVSYNHTYPSWSNFTGPDAALYDPSNLINTDQGLTEWIEGGLSANKLVLSLPFCGYAWTLENPKDNGIGAPAKGPAITKDGFLTYKEIKNYTKRYGPDVHVRYNSTYVGNYWTKGTTWIGFDDAEAVRAKVAYAREKNLLGYFVWEVSFDDNWVLSQAAADQVRINNSSALEDNKTGKNKRSSSVILFSTTVAAILVVGILVIFYCWRRKLILKGMSDSSKQQMNKANKAVAAGDLNSNVPNLIEYTLADIEAATNGFSIENKLGQGGYGPVYKGILPDGQEIAVKKLAKTSTQGFEEFKNEVTLTAKLQHINLVRVLGYCIEEEEHILIYEYMPNRSLHSYLFDPIRRYVLNWEKRAHIIEGVTQGFLYLQDYSRLTIIHRDLKVSNVLLDKDMKPKISDFGMAKIFAEDDPEANTRHIVGTLGYIPPEYIHGGTYSTKSDVYSFGVLLLQIISGKRISLLYGPSESLSLPDYAYELWNNGKGMEFMDESLDDTYSSCKLMRCLQIALFCVQENPKDRPSMLKVFSMLKNETKDMMIMKKPAFSTQISGKEPNKSSLQLKGYSGSTTSSINDVTVSKVVAR